MRSERYGILRFAIVGGIGFIIDGGILTIFGVLGENLYVGRSISFTVASFATWLLNRTFTFAESRQARRSDISREYLYYVGVQVVGALLNLGVFTILLRFLPALQRYPIVPLSAGAALAMVFNYSCLRLTVYRGGS